MFELRPVSMYFARAIRHSTSINSCLNNNCYGNPFGVPAFAAKNIRSIVEVGIVSSKICVRRQNAVKSFQPIFG